MLEEKSGDDCLVVVALILDIQHVNFVDEKEVDFMLENEITSEQIQLIDCEDENVRLIKRLDRLL